MRAFRFRLERVLGLAEAERRESARQLGEAQERLQSRAAEVRAAETERLRAEQSVPTGEGSTIRLEAWLSREDEVEAWRREERLAAGRLAEQRDRVAERQAEYLVARQEERLLQAIRERRRVRWQVENGRREQAEIDDLAQVARGFRLRRTRAAKGGDESGQGDSIHFR